MSRSIENCARSALRPMSLTMTTRARRLATSSGPVQDGVGPEDADDEHGVDALALRVARGRKFSGSALPSVRAQRHRPLHPVSEDPGPPSSRGELRRDLPG